jgi:hypothetical protein
LQRIRLPLTRPPSLCVAQAGAKERELEKIAEAHVRKMASEAARAADVTRAAEEAVARDRAEVCASLAGAVDRGMAEAEKLRVRVRLRCGAPASRVCVLWTHAKPSLTPSSSPHLASQAAAKRKEAADMSAVPTKRHCMWTLATEVGEEELSDEDEEEAAAAAGGAAGKASAGARGKKGRAAARAASPPPAPPSIMAPPAARRAASPPPPAAAAAAPAPAPAPAPAAAAAAPHAPVDLSRFASPAQLESLGLEALKAELSSRGLKCGGTLCERAARLFLLKSATLEQLDAKHKAPPPKHAAKR